MRRFPRPTGASSTSSISVRRMACRSSTASSDGVGRGIGIERRKISVERMRQRGIDAIHGDATKLEAAKVVRFVSMMNFLEHLPDLKAVEDMIARAATAATDFIYIRHPSFEGEELAPFLGYCQHWWNWRHHRAHIRIVDYCAMFERLGIGPYSIRYFGPVTHTSHPSIISTGLPKNLNATKAAAYPKPSDSVLPQTWWQRQDIFVALRKFDTRGWAKLTRPSRREAAFNASAAMSSQEADDAC